MRTSLFTTYYDEKNPDRKEELDYCLKKNIENPLIDRIVILNESSLSFHHPKITDISYKKRPSFNAFFDIINNTTTENDINIIANSDIYFDHTLVKARRIKKNSIYALTRWDVINETPVFYNKEHSQDCWIFRGKINFIFKEILLGIPGCDNSLLWIFHKEKFKIKNPSFDIRILHKHASNIRNYNSNSYPPPYKYILPGFICNFHFFTFFFINKCFSNDMILENIKIRILKPIFKIIIKLFKELNLDTSYLVSIYNTQCRLL